MLSLLLSDRLVIQFQIYHRMPLLQFFVLVRVPQEIVRQKNGASNWIGIFNFRKGETRYRQRSRAGWEDNLICYCSGHYTSKNCAASGQQIHLRGDLKQSLNTQMNRLWNILSGEMERWFVHCSFFSLIGVGMMSYSLDVLNQGTIWLEIFLCVGAFLFVFTNGMLL